MERKRKLPARAAARGEHVSKKRNSTPPDASTTSTPSSTMTSPQPPEVVSQEPPPPTATTTTVTSSQLPKSLQPGHPLPTVEKPQPDDLSNKEFQSIQESGVMAESLSRSRQKWINDGVFEKYWTKPTKRKGVVKEDANNPAKDTMTKIGQVTITVEPHVLEATMYAVKDPKSAPTSNPSFRPIIQYGPSNGSMPPPPKPDAVPATAASSSSATSKAQAPMQNTQPAQSARSSLQPVPLLKEDKKPAPQQHPRVSAIPSSSTPPSQQPDLQRPQLPTHIESSNPVASPRGLESVLAAPQSAHTPLPGPAHSRPPQSSLSQPTAPSNHPLHAPSASPTPLSTGATLPAGSAGNTKTAAPAVSKPAQPPASGADPIIVTLAERASEDPHLRDLMKRVAVGEAAAHELAHFQRIIDQITADYKRKGSLSGPDPEKLFVDGRTVKYFADEVRAIVDIILASNPAQRSKDLRPPPGIDPLILLLVRETLDKSHIREAVQRITDGKQRYTDPVELKATLDGLHSIVKQDLKCHETAAATDSQSVSQSTPAQLKGEDAAKKTPTSTPTPTPTQPQGTQNSQQALRSKGPPPSTKPDISAVVLEFAGGTGDRYLFPKYSILEFSPDCTQVVTSFLIVRRGSKLEYGGDRELDYYQPITLRIHSHSPKVLEHLARVVAPQEEVQRYMDDVMENMTRAEYVLLAMRLPRAEREDPIDERSDTPKGSETSQPSQLPNVLWDHRSTPVKPGSIKPTSAKSAGEDEQYQNFIATVS
ncbi:hypothetical protein F5B22DRAFT_636036 [Xylaria bambusicola]|uniref:uncharacterized protein n=1 Tax=Xylaria bambusicola TaxID=326684 RepID=UPI002008DEB9|nr:uncharacterized protein F5B22DRAFT_636036 [Xylaria bambusicola]KAI0517095.1 hypothetical protein F5B22DRAFT_636036 [Xylaria bambusicola]